MSLGETLCPLGSPLSYLPVYSRTITGLPRLFLPVISHMCLGARLMPEARPHHAILSHSPVRNVGGSRVHAMLQEHVCARNGSLALLYVTRT